jgi:hypothetical protein
VLRALLGLGRLGSCRIFRALCHPRVVFRRTPARWGALGQAAHPWWHVRDMLSRRLASGATAQHQAGARQENWKDSLARHAVRLPHDCGLKPVNSGRPYHPICRHPTKRRLPGYASRLRSRWAERRARLERTAFAVNSGVSHGSNDRLLEMRKTNGPGCHHLRPHRASMYKL